MSTMCLYLLFLHIFLFSITIIFYMNNFECISIRAKTFVHLIDRITVFAVALYNARHSIYVVSTELRSEIKG